MRCVLFRGTVGGSVLQDIPDGWRTRWCGQSTYRTGSQSLARTTGTYTVYTQDLIGLFMLKKYQSFVFEICFISEIYQRECMMK